MFCIVPFCYVRDNKTIGIFQFKYLIQNVQKSLQCSLELVLFDGLENLLTLAAKSANSALSQLLLHFIDNSREAQGSIW